MRPSESDDSIRKGSLSADHAGDTPPPPPYLGATTNRPHTQQTPDGVTAREPCAVDGNIAFPLNAPHRRAYVNARVAGSVLSIVLIVLASVALRSFGRRRWFSAMLSPAINSLVLHALDLWFVWGTHTRFPPLLRLFWDGMLGVGFMISGGFMASFAAAEVAYGGGPDEINPVSGSVALAAVCVAFLGVEMLIHLGFAVGGWRNWREPCATPSRSSV